MRDRNKGSTIFLAIFNLSAKNIADRHSRSAARLSPFGLMHVRSSSLRWAFENHRGRTARPWTAQRHIFITEPAQKIAILANYIAKRPLEVYIPRRVIPQRRR
jgi:hypothetical protein